MSTTYATFPTPTAGRRAPAAIRAEGLVKSFGETRALAGVDLDVEPGTVCAVLGRNGAGKTTAVRILTTLIRPDAGRAEVAGFDVARDPGRVRARIGVAAQSATMDELLTGRENLELVGRMVHLPRARVRARAAELLATFRLTDAADRLVRTYSGGMRRRLDIAASLVAAPPVLFLDEPTTGLDPVSRGELWRAIRGMAAGGTTVLLTTQYLEEADQLADEIALVDGGVVAARGTPARLKAAIGRARVRVTLPDGGAERVAAARAALGPEAEVAGATLRLPAPDGLDDLAAAVQRLRAGAVEVADVALEQPSLDEVFAALTGSPAAPDSLSANPPPAAGSSAGPNSLGANPPPADSRGGMGGVGS